MLPETVDEFQEQRGRLFGIAYGMLGTATDAEDVLQDAWLPEPVLTADGALGPLDDVVQRESVSLALLALLERLPPAERAAYVLREDVVSRADGGGIVHAARRPVRGRNDVARYLVGLVHRFGMASRPVLAEVNGVPAIALVEGAGLRGVLVLHTAGGLLTALDLVVNPEKLAFAERQLSRIGGLPGLSG